MKKNISYILLLFAVVIVVSCNTESTKVNRPINKAYAKILDEINIECNQDTIEYYISARINDQQFCYYEKRPKDFVLTIGEVNNKSLASNSNKKSGYRKFAILKLGDHLQHHNSYFAIHFPDLSLSRSNEVYFDSLFANKNYDVIGSEDVVIPKGVSLAEELMIKSGGGELNQFLIELNTLDKKSDTHGELYSIKSIFGNQENSYIRISKAEKSIELGELYYYLEIDFECNLYHSPHTGYEGLWGVVREGKIITKIRMKE